MDKLSQLQAKIREVVKSFPDIFEEPCLSNDVFECEEVLDSMELDLIAEGVDDYDSKLFEL